MNRFLLLLLSVALLSCQKDDVQVPSIDEQIVVWLDTMNITATRDNSGIYFYPEIENITGADVLPESIVAIYYTLQDLESNVIASYQRSDGDSLLFKQGVSAVYPIGVDIAAGLMKVGETYHFIIPPSQAYGGLTSGAIDSKEIIHLTLQVVGLENETNILAQELAAIDQYIIDENLNDTIANPLNSVKQFPASGVSTKRLRAGIGAQPLNGDTIVLDYTARTITGLDVDDESDFEFYFGDNAPRPFIAGFEFGVSSMQTNEESLIIIPSSQAYRESALVIPSSIALDLVEDAIIPNYVAKVAPYSTLLFRVTRVD